MAFWSRTKKDSITLFLKQNFGIKPKNIALYQQAFTHSSSVKNGLDSNERLEFLGDAILDSVISEYLYEHYPNKSEGFLTQMRSKIVKGTSLNRVGAALKLSKLLKKQKNVRKISIEGNAFEALLGALFLDAGFKKTKQIILRLLDEHYSLVELEKTEMDFKSSLYQWCQKEKMNLETRFVRCETSLGFSYAATLLIEETVIGEGSGPSKKSAEKIAAKQALASGVLDKINVKK